MRYINPIDSRIAFERLLRSPCYVDKTGLIVRIAPLIDTEQSFLCITRPRRFGKTVNARMLACFLSRGPEAPGLFEGLEVASQPQAMAHLHGYDVIYIDFSSLPQDCGGYPDYIGHIAGGLIEDLRRFAPLADIPEDETDVVAALERAFSAEGKRFCFVIEWDSMFFNQLFSEKDQRAFLMFLEQLLESRAYVEFAYMTGILPIVKHSSRSKLNMFAGCSAIGAAHDREVPLLRFANESDLAALVNLVYLAAWDHCQMRREEPAGKGVADVAFIPMNAADARWVPFVIELKAGGSAQDAIAQIRSRDYLALFRDCLVGEDPSMPPLAVGIAWDPVTRTHECAVEPLWEEVG